MSKPKKAVNSPMGQSASPQRLNPIYPKPTVPVALGEFLSPKQVTAAGLEVVVTYPSIKPGDVIALKFNGDDTFVPIEVRTRLLFLSGFRCRTSSKPLEQPSTFNTRLAMRALDRSQTYCS